MKNRLPLLRSIITFCLVLLGHMVQAQVSGTVFKDFNANGTKQTSTTYTEPGQLGVRVIATRPDGSTLTVTYTGSGTATNSSGGYAVTGGTLGQIRLEFLLPDTYTFASNGASGGTPVMFPTTATQDLAVNYPQEYSQTDPQIAIPCFTFGAPTLFGNDPAIVSDVFSKREPSGTPVHDKIWATNSKVGATLGLAYSKTRNQLFVSAFTKRYSGFGPGNGTTHANGSPGAIYRITGTGTVSTLIDLPAAEIGVNPHNNTVDFQKDPAWWEIGTTSWGDIDISDDETKIYAINLFNRKLYEIDITTGAVSNSYFIPGITGGVAFTGPTTNNNTDLRPFGVKFYKGKVYVGIVCTAESEVAVDPDKGVNPNVRGYVFTFTPGVGFSGTPVVNFPMSGDPATLTYLKDVTTNNKGYTMWYPRTHWVANGSDWDAEQLDDFTKAVIADIDFINGDMVIGIRDLRKDLYANQDGTFYPDGNTPVSASRGGSGSQGRLYRLSANATSTVFTMENNGRSNGVLGNNTNTYYKQYRTHDRGDYFGSIAALNGYNTIMTQSQPGSNNGAIVFLDDSNGGASAAGELNKIFDYNPGSLPNPLFAKANGLGDIEVLAAPSPIEVGNRVWNDTDNDGIQDAGETGIAGISVSLCTGAGVSIATAVTDANGQYYFSNGTGTSTASAKYSLTTLTANTTYQLKFPTTNAGKSLVPANASADNIDSDPLPTGIVSFSTANLGENNHSFDAGYGTAICALTATATPGVCNSATNQYSVNGVINLTANTAGGTATITDGARSMTVSVPAAATSVAYSLTGLTSGTGSHTVTVNLPGCGSAMATYSAPASCTFCSLSITTATLPNGQVGTAYSQTISTTGGTGSLIFVSNGNLPAGLNLNAATGVISGTPASATTASFTVSVTDGKNCSAVAPLTITTTALPICSLTATVTAGLCNSATNTYSSTVVVRLTNPAAGVITISDGSTSQTLTVTNSTTGAAVSFNGLIADGAVRTVQASLSTCGTNSTTYAAPASCSIAPTCSLTVTPTAGVCNTATNTYSSTVVVRIANTNAGGILTITDGAISETLAVGAGLSVFTGTATFNGLASNGSSHLVSASLAGCSSQTATYTAPASCSVAPCALSITTAMLPNGQAGTAYSQTITTSGGTAPLAYTISAGALPTGLALSAAGVISGMPTSATTGSFTIRVTDARNCSAVVPLTITTSSSPVCSLTATATPGPCNSANNQYAITGTISATNTTGNSSVTVSIGTVNTVVALTGNGPASYTLAGLTSDGSNKAVSVISSACGQASVTYNAPVSCTVTPSGLAVLVGMPVCNTLTNNYTASGTISLTNAPAGTLTITDNGTSVAVVSVTAGQTSASFSVSGTSNASSHTVVATLANGVTVTANTTYQAPASCTFCSLSITTSALTSGTVGTAYSQTIVLSGAVGSPIFTNTGTLPNGLNLNAATGVISGTPTAAGASSFTIRVTDGKNCSATVPMTVSVVCPTFAITANSATICAGQTTTLTASGASSYAWSQGGNTASIVVSPTATQTYSVTGISAAGCPASTTARVTVNGLPQVNGVSQAPCVGTVAGLTVNAINTGAGVLEYSLNGGAFQTTNSFTINAATSTTAVVVVRTQGSSCSATESVVVNCACATPVSLTFVPTALQTCAGSPVSFTAGVAGATSATLTSSGTGTFSQNVITGATTVSYQPSQADASAGSVTLILTSADPDGSSGACVADQVTRMLTINPVPSVSATSASICAGETATLMASGAAIYRWNTGATTQSISVSVAGAYSVTGTTAQGCSATTTGSVTVQPVPTITLRRRLLIRANLAVLSASGCTGGTINWSTDGAGLPATNASSITVAAPFGTRQSYTAVCTTTAGCSALATISLNREPNGDELAVNDAVVCSATSAILSATGCTGGSLLWSTGATTRQISVPGASANFTVVCSDALGIQEAVASVSAVAAPSLTLTASPSQTVTTGNSVTLTVAGCNSGTLNWSAGVTGQMSAVVSPTLGSNMYSVTCTLAGGCSATAQITLVGTTANQPQLVLRKAVSKSRARLGEVVSYTVTLVNTGAASATGVVVSDTYTAGVSLVPGSISTSAGSFTPGLNGGQWTIASLPAGATATLTFSASLTQEGISFNTASIPDQEVSVCTSVPVQVCKGLPFEVELSAPAGRSRYQWYLTPVGASTSTLVADGTLNDFTATVAGEYQVVVDNGLTNVCPAEGCCPVLIEEVEVPSYTALARNPSCVGGTPQPNGQITLVNLGNGPAQYVYQVSPGTSFSASTAVPGSATAVPGNGVVATGLLPGNYTIRVWVLIDGAPSCPRDLTVAVVENCACPEDICLPVIIRKTKSRGKTL